MAVVGDAHIIVRAITDKVESDIRNGFRGADRVGRRAGESMGDAFSRGFNKTTGKNLFSRFSDGISEAIPDAEAARLTYARLTRTLLSIGPAIGTLIGGVSSLVGGLGALVGSAGGAASAVAALGNVFAGVRIGFSVAKLALDGVSEALKKLNSEAGGGSAVADNTKQIEDAQRRLAEVIEDNRERLSEANNRVEESQVELNEALEEGREELQKIAFSAEDAALAEERAALELERARETLARTQDLPPNSRVRRESELAFKEAELNYRQAKDRASDLNDEQQRLAETGVAGTDVVIRATERLAQAEADKARTVRDGIRAQEEAERALKDLLEAGKGGGGGGSDPFAGLNKFQKDFVKFLSSLKPLYEELKLAASEAFLVPLEQAITLLAERAFPTLKQGISDVAGAMGQAAISIALAATQAEALNDTAQLFRTSASIIRSLGRTLGNVWSAALSILSEASPVALRFVNFLEERSGALASFLDVKQATGELEAFFNRAGQIAADWGRILGNTFAGIGQLIQANFAPGSGGDYLVQWLITATDKFRNLDDTAGGADSLSEYFLGAAVNTQKILSSIGALLTELIALGDNDAIGETFDILAEGAPAVGDLVEKLIEAGPAMAELVVQFTEFANKLTDSKSIDIFFGTLGTALNLINSLLKNELIMNILIAVSQVAAFALALGTIQKTGMFVFKAIAGSVGFFSGAIGIAVGKVQFLSAALSGQFPAKAAAARAALGGMISAGAKAVGLIAVFSGVASAMTALTREAEISEAALIRMSDSVTGVASTNFDEVFSTDAIGRFGGAAEETRVTLERMVGGDWDALKGLSGAFSLLNNGDLEYFTEAEDKLLSFGATLGEVAGVNLGQAQTAFQDFASQTDGTDETLIKFLDLMPGFKQELRELAEANGLATDDTTLLGLAMGDTEGSGRILADQFNNTSAATLDTTGSIQRLADAVRGFTDDAISGERAAIRFEEKMDDLTNATKKQKEEGFDRSTEAGRRNELTFLDAAQAMNDMTVANYENGGSLDELRADYAKNREELIKQAEAYGLADGKAEEYVNTLLKTPDQLESTIELSGAPESKGDIEGVQQAATTFSGPRGSPKSYAARLNAQKGDWAEVQRAINAANASYTTTVNVNQRGNGGFANGAIQSYANGGFASGIYRGRQGNLYKFAEPETRWEAFISGKPSMRQRNVEIWKEVGKRLGVELMPNAIGGMYTQIASTMSSRVDSPYQTTSNARSMNQNYNNIVITVNPAEKIDKSELSSSISKEISFQMRRGSVA